MRVHESSPRCTSAVETQRGAVNAAVEQSQFATPAPAAPGGRAAQPPGEAVPPGTRLLQAFSRSDVPINSSWREYPEGSGQWVGTIDSGVQLLIYGMTVNAPRGPVPLGPLDVSADRMVIWTRGEQAPAVHAPLSQPEGLPLEIYMEGNIIFRQGERTIYADRMYYDVRNKVGTVFKGELLAAAQYEDLFPPAHPGTPPQNSAARYEGILRFHAEIIQLLGPSRLLAHDAFVTSSRMGEPGYRLQMENLEYHDEEEVKTDPFTGLPIRDPETQEPIVSHQRLLTAQNDVVYLDDVPVFYWPSITTDLTDSTFYLRQVQLKTDSIFGTQVLTDWDMYQLLGAAGLRNKPAGTQWDLDLDYMSARGFGYGTKFTYNRQDFFGIEGKTVGLIDFWGIEDHGLDNLGFGRRLASPEESYRFRLWGQHREMLPDDFQLSVELGVASDRNFLQQYFQREYDELKNESTDVELKKTYNNMSWNVFASAQLEDFVTDTQWLPKFDHYWLGQPLVNDVFTWYEHTLLGFAQFQTLLPPPPPTPSPQNPDYVFNFLPWEVSTSGQRLNIYSAEAVTRQEIDWPFQAGPVKVVPYALGELAYWSDDRAGQNLDCAYSQVGVRATLPLWKVDPDVKSDLFNVNGLAHKIFFNAEFAWTDVNKDLSQLPLYEPLDDYSIEDFRRRFVPLTFPFQPGFPPSLQPIPRSSTNAPTPSGRPWLAGSPPRAWRLPGTSWPCVWTWRTGGRRSAALRATNGSSTGSRSTRKSPFSPRTARTLVRCSVWPTTIFAGRSATVSRSCPRVRSTSSRTARRWSRSGLSSTGHRAAACTWASAIWTARSITSS